ncbi:MAG: hypothetical protein Q8S84_03135 [bacterium]|nr:hypothetical protein [bacterium]MDP3380524.1 hypothetical protein [bacterium]
MLYWKYILSVVHEKDILLEPNLLLAVLITHKSHHVCKEFDHFSSLRTLLLLTHSYFNNIPTLSQLGSIHTHHCTTSQ